MNEREKVVVSKVVKEMKNAYGVVHYWMKGSPIDITLADWINQLESLLEVSE